MTLPRMTGDAGLLMSTTTSESELLAVTYAYEPLTETPTAQSKRDDEVTLPTMDPKLSDGELALAILLKLRRMINQPPGCGSPRVRPRAPCVPTRIVCALCVLAKFHGTKLHSSSALRYNVL